MVCTALLMSRTEPLIAFADLLIGPTASLTCLRLESMLLAESTMRPMVGLRFEAASRIWFAVSCTLARIGTVSSLLLIGPTSLLMTPTRFSIRLADARMPVRKITARSAQKMTITSIIPGRAWDVKRRISHLLRVALERRQQGQRRRGADVGQVAVGLLELKVDVGE